MTTDTTTTTAAIDALLQGAEWQDPENLRRYLFPAFSALAAERDAALRERDAGAKDYCALMDRHDAEFVRAEKAETEAAALRYALALMVNHAEWREQKEGVYWEATDKARAALTRKGGA